MSNNININRKISGKRNEDALCKVIQSFSSCIYQNVKLPTNTTKRLFTEIDIIFYYKGTIFIIETKNVVSIEGTLTNPSWSLTSKSGEYKNYNPIVQNKLHTRVFKNRFFERYKYFPNVISLVIVPDGTIYPDELKSEVITPDILFMYLQKFKHTYDVLLRYQFISFLQEVYSR